MYSHLCMSVPVSMYVSVEAREEHWKSSSTALYLTFESGISLPLDPTLLHRFDWPQSFTVQCPFVNEIIVYMEHF